MYQHSSLSQNSSEIFGASYILGNLASDTKEPQPVSPIPQRKTTSTRADKTKKLLPIDFEPTDYSVICGNKQVFFNSHGNRRFRVICQTYLSEYLNAGSKHEKSIVVTKVVRTLRDACPVGAFVAFEKGRWWEVSDRASREKVGTFLRDCLADNYKSSSKNKIAQRRKKRQLEHYAQSYSNVLYNYSHIQVPVKPAPVATTLPAPADCPANTYKSSSRTKNTQRRKKQQLQHSNQDYGIMLYDYSHIQAPGSNAPAPPAATFPAPSVMPQSPDALVTPKRSQPSTTHQHSIHIPTNFRTVPSDSDDDSIASSSTAYDPIPL